MQRMCASASVQALHRTIGTKHPLDHISCGQGGVSLRQKFPIFYNALMLTGVNLLLRFVATSFQVYISGKIGPAGVGLLQLVLSVGAMAMTAGMAGVRTATMYLTAEELGKKRPQNVIWVLSGSVLYSILCSSAVAACVYFSAPFLANVWIGNADTVGAIRLLAGFIPVNCLCGVMTGYFTAANRISTLAAVEVAEQMLYMAVTMTALTVWAGSNSALACSCVVLGSGISACVTLVTLMVFRVRERQKHGARIPIRSRLLHTAVPLAIADDFRTGISTTENLMVPKRLALFGGVDAPLAAFGMVCGMVFPVLMFPAAILFGLAELLIPELARCAAAGSKTRIDYLVRRSLKVALLYGCCFCGLMFVLADDLCIWLYQNARAGAQLRLYATLIPVLYCDAITDAMTKGLGQQKACVRYNIITSSMDVAFLYLLLPKYGMSGYFFSFLVTHLLNFGLSLRRLLKISGSKLPLHVMLTSIIATVAAIFAGANFSAPALKAGAFLVCFGCLLFLFQVLSKEDILWLKGLVKAT